MNLDDLLKEMKEKMRNRDLSDEYLREHNNSTREEIGIGEYAYGITMIPCEWVYKYLSDYKRVLKENEELNKKIKEQKECAFREDGTEECLWYCSNCHDEWLFYEGTPEENNLKYCPHCGAKVTKYESYIETEIEIANKMAKDYLKESE